jgi:predicted membrane protein
MKKIGVFLIIFFFSYFLIFQYAKSQKEGEEILKIEPHRFFKEYILPPINKLISIGKEVLEKIKKYPLWQDIKREYEKRKEIAKREINRKKDAFFKEFLDLFKKIFGDKKGEKRP